jgi:hypothetical protein
MKVKHIYTRWEYGIFDYVIFSRGKETTIWTEDSEEK